MAKLITVDLNNLSNPTTVISTINGNFTAVETAVENTLSRDGTSPNEMEADFDMNSHRILNCPSAISNGEPITLNQFNSSAVRYDIAQGLTSEQKQQARTNIGTGPSNISLLLDASITYVIDGGGSAITPG